MENCCAVLTAVAEGKKKYFVFTHAQEMLGF